MRHEDEDAAQQVVVADDDPPMTQVVKRALLKLIGQGPSDINLKDELEDTPARRSAFQKEVNEDAGRKSDAAIERLGEFGDKMRNAKMMPGESEEDARRKALGPKWPGLSRPKDDPYGIRKRREQK